MEAENIVDKKELKGLPIWACILLFIVVFFVFMLLYSALIQGFLSLVLGVEARHPGIVGYILQETGMLLTALTSAVIMLRFERRPFSDLGLSVKGHARGLWYGLLIAVLFYLVGFGLSLLLGEIEVTGFKFEPVNLLGSWVFFLLVALFEEILMRGYILGRLLHTRMNKFLSLFISSALFALLHIFNPEIDFLPMLNLLLAGMLLGASYLLVLFGFLLAIANKLLMRHPTRLIARQKLLLRIPIMGSLMRGQKLTQIFTILTLTQSAGISFLQGVESVRETMRCPYWVQLLTQIQHDISNGHPIWLALKNAGEFSPLCLQLVRTGEASGSLDLMLDNLAHHHRDNTMALADNLAALLEPALLIITGGIIGTLVVAMYLPIFHLGDAMSGMG